jgi:NDP-sugar pyrophosphorylase family protein
MKQKVSVTIEDSVLKDIDAVVDNITIRNRSQAIEFLARNALGDRKAAVILSGGDEGKLAIGSEYRITARVGGSTVIERALRKLRENGFRDVYIVARQKVLTRVFDLIRDGSGYSVSVQYVEEKEGTGSGDTLKLVKGKVHTNFLVVYGHIIFDKINIESIWNKHMRQHAVATLMLTTSAKPQEKGTVSMEGDKILEFVQKPKKTDVHLVFSPLFVASPDVFNYTRGRLEYEVFPRLAKLGLLQGHVSSEKEVHIHSEKDMVGRASR